MWTLCVSCRFCDSPVGGPSRLLVRAEVAILEGWAFDGGKYFGWVWAIAGVLARGWPIYPLRVQLLDVACAQSPAFMHTTCFKPLRVFSCQSLGPFWSCGQDFNTVMLDNHQFHTISTFTQQYSYTPGKHENARENPGTWVYSRQCITNSLFKLPAHTRVMYALFQASQVV